MTDEPVSDKVQKYITRRDTRRGVTIKVPVQAEKPKKRCNCSKTK